MKELPLVENHSLTFKWMRLFTLIIEEAEKVDCIRRNRVDHVKAAISHPTMSIKLMDRYIPTCIP